MTSDNASEGTSADWRETTYGFTWGGMKFERLFSDRVGVVARIGGTGTDDHVEVFVSPKGRSVRVFCHGCRDEAADRGNHDG